MPSFDDALATKLTAELTRILGTESRNQVGLSFELPIVSPDDVVEFLRSVPTGTSRDGIVALAAEYAKYQPTFDADHEDWAVIEISPPLPNER